MRVHLIDGTYELFRHFYAVPSARDESGREVGAVRGVVASILAMINRGTTQSYKTTVGKGCFIMSYVHLAHDCHIGDGVILVNSVQLAGHVTVGEKAITGAGSVVLRNQDVPDGAVVVGVPARPIRRKT